MKVKEIYIKKYHQFEDFHLNLTYPQGHEKAGQPLDKVCIIGQSGTGKTSLLELIGFFIAEHRISIIGENVIPDLEDGFKLTICTPKTEFIIWVKDNKVVSPVRINSKIVSYNKYISGEHPRPRQILEQHFNITNNINTWLIYYPAEVSNHSFSFDPQKEKPNSFDALFNHIESFLTEKDRIFDFSKQDFSKIWKTISNSISTYHKSLLQKRIELSEVIQKINVSDNEVMIATQKFREWYEKTFNPEKDIAENYLNKILNRFSLEVKTEFSPENALDTIGLIQIQTKKGEIIPFKSWSTGTKQVILTSLPLYALKPKNTIILFDEPERSLYPDVQTEIVDFYTSMAEDSQFFFATHSPLVASSFDPWEIVELKFNEKGTVYQEQYFHGERHVDNYFINPKYLNWDGILRRIFDIEEDGNPQRIEALMRLSTLESRLKKNNASKELKAELWNEYKKLAEQLDWEINTANA